MVPFFGSNKANRRKKNMRRKIQGPIYSLGKRLHLKRKPAAACFLTILLLASAVGLLPFETARANPVGQILPWKTAPYITINIDGSITPDLGLVSRSGNTYTLTGNVSDYTIAIQCINIVFDGDGHSINVAAYNTPDENGKLYTANFQSYGIYLGGYQMEITNVTIKNVEITSNWRAIRLYNCSSCLITAVTSQDYIDIGGDDNVVTNCSAVFGISGYRNTIFKNNISVLCIGNGGANLFYLNNIFDISPPFASNNFLDNGSFGNYWGDYKVRYPNASEIGQTGVGDTPYVIDGCNIDNYPLMNPLNFETSQPIQEKTNDPSLTVYAVFIAVSIVVVAIVLIYYQKKRKP
jgi:hypothetical protein